MESDRFDPVLILCKAANLSWPAVKALIMSSTSGNGMSTCELDDGYANLRPASGFDRASRRALLAGAAGERTSG